MKQAIILGKQTPDALIRLSPPSQRAWWIINKFSAVNREDAAPSACQNTRLSAPTDCHFADGGRGLHRKLTRVKDVERRGSNYKCLADDVFVFRAMDLRVPRSGTLDIRTKSKLAENLRKQWNHWIWFIKNCDFEMYWQEACSNYIVKSLTLISSDTSKKSCLIFLKHYHWFFYVCCKNIDFYFK